MRVCLSRWSIHNRLADERETDVVMMNENEPGCPWVYPSWSESQRGELSRVCLLLEVRDFLAEICGFGQRGQDQQMISTP
ncbi:hypothetical protein LDENG_00016660 [Lucifuga dentata]|nr:hypothetical protein LDENG_00016660 [Lucifuga dentata]